MRPRRALHTVLGWNALRAGYVLAALASDQQPPSTRDRLVLVACILGSMIVFVDSTVVNVALPAIQRDLGGGLALQQWVVDAYLLTLGSLLLVGGSLGDLFGARRLFLIGIVAFGLTSVLCAAAPDGTLLILARGLQGVAGALLTPAGLAVIASTFSGEERGAAIGAWTAWTGIAFVIGPLVGGWLVTNASWRWVFLINVPFAVATAALVVYAVPKSHHQGKRASVDVLGGVLCVLGLGGPVFALIEAPQRGFGDPLIRCVALRRCRCLRAVPALGEPRTATDAAAAALLAPQLLLREPGDPDRLRRALDSDVLPRPVSAAACGLLALRSGLALVPITVVMFFLSPRVGRLSMRLGPRLVHGHGPFIAAVALLATIRLGRGFSYWWELLPVLLVFAVGLSMIVAPLTATVLADAGERDAGIASGVNNAVARVAGLLGIAVVGAAVAGQREPARPGRVPTRDGDHRRCSSPSAASIRRSPGSGTRRRAPTEADEHAEIVFDHVTKRYAGRDERGTRRPLARDPGRRRSACSSARRAAGRRPRSRWSTG